MNTKFIGAIIGIIAVALIGGIIVFALRQSAPEAAPLPDGQGAGQQEAAPEQAPVTNQNGSSDTSTGEEVTEVGIVDFAFQPADITVKRGTTVTWTNTDAIRHDVTSSDGIENGPQSELLAQGESYSFTFDEVGEFTYYCSPHPYMEGKVTVVE